MPDDDLGSIKPHLLHQYWAELSREDRFNATIFENDDVLFVLRMHLIFETLMAELLDIRFPDSAILLDRLTFSRKVDVLYESTPTPAILRDSLKGANWVRNRFAHLPMSFILSEETWQKFKTFLPAQYLELIEEQIALGKSGAVANPDVPAASPVSRIRWGFMMIHKGLTTLLGMAHGYPKPEEFI